MSSSPRNPHDCRALTPASLAAARFSAAPTTTTIKTKITTG